MKRTGAAERSHERLAAHLAELARGAVVVDPDLARQRDHDREIEHLRERVAVGDDVVGARRGLDEEALRKRALPRVGIARDDRVHRILEQRAVAVRERVRQFIELDIADLLTNRTAAEVGRARHRLRDARRAAAAGRAGGHRRDDRKEQERRHKPRVQPWIASGHSG